MREIFQKILDEYKGAKKSNFSNNELANYIRSESGKLISISVILTVRNIKL